MKGREISGIVVSVFGFILIVASLFITTFILIYGVPIFVIGLFIIFNKNEDRIEEIKGGKIK